MSRTWGIESADQFVVSDLDKTIVEVQTEVDRLKSQGIDKIILLSHVGYIFDKVIAARTSGIDVILGGHSHDLIEGVKTGENLLYSKTGEPVIITQAGRDGKYFGVLNLEFNNNGIITKIQNNVMQTKDFTRDAAMGYAFNKIWDSKALGMIKSAPSALDNDLIEPSGHADFIADTLKKTYDADIALICSAYIRGAFEPGKIDRRALDDIIPFKNRICLVDYSEKDIVDALKYGGISMLSLNNKPGILNPSGLKYTMSKSGELLGASFIDKSGKEFPINISNPREDKFYKVVLNEYLASGNDNFTMLDKSKRPHKVLDTDVNNCLDSYISSLTEPLTIPPSDGRVKIV
jgi:5'-nucleotidase